MAWFGTNHAKLGAFVRCNPRGRFKAKFGPLGPSDTVWGSWASLGAAGRRRAPQVRSPMLGQSDTRLGHPLDEPKRPRKHCKPVFRGTGAV